MSTTWPGTVFSSPAFFASIFSAKVWPIATSILQRRSTGTSLLVSLQIKIREIRVMKDDGLRAALELVALPRMGGDDVQHGFGDAMFITQCNASEGVAQILIHAGELILVCLALELDQFAHVGEQRPGDESIPVAFESLAVRLAQDIVHRNAQTGHRADVLRKRDLHA